MAAAAQTPMTHFLAEINHDRLGFAFCVALALHAALILGVGFNREERAVAAPQLEITLAQHRAEKAPTEADFLAQSHQEGSGTLENKAMLTTPEQAAFNDNTLQQVSPQQQIQQQREREANTTLVTTAAASDRQVTRKPLAEQQQQQESEQSADYTALQRSREIASLEAKLERQRQAYAKRPRIRRLTSMATQQSDDALYLHNWRTRIEAIGNRNYPALARQQQLYGDLRMVVSLLPNGAVHEVKILESSGHKILDQAAIRIVHLAAPYDPFPQAMRRKVDVLEIIRTWRFHKDGLTSSS